MGSKPTKMIYLVSTILGLVGIVNEFFYPISFLPGSLLGLQINFLLLMVAFGLLWLGVTFKGL